MEIKILGTGCPNCKRLEQTAREAAATLGVDATFVKVTGVNEIMSYPIAHTPALVINGQVKCSGRQPSVQEVMAWLQEN